jgi:hypothetical protein
MDYQQNAQRDAITQALMNVASPPPQPQMPQSRAQAIMGTGNAQSWGQQGQQPQMPQMPPMPQQQLPPQAAPALAPAAGAALAPASGAMPVGAPPGQPGV